MELDQVSAGNVCPRSYTAARAAQTPFTDPEWGGAYTYRMLKSGPDVHAEEAELLHSQALEVVVSWGSNVLQVMHLAPPRSYYVGESENPDLPCDFVVPSEKLGAPRLPLLLEFAGVVKWVIPPRATGYLDIPGQTRLSLEELRARAEPCAEVPGGHQIPLHAGAHGHIELGDLAFDIAAVHAGKPLKRGVAIDASALAYFTLSFLVNSGLMASLAYFAPALGLTDDEALEKEDLYLMRQYLQASAEREHAEPEPAPGEGQPQAGSSGAAASGDQGSLGNPTVTTTQLRYAVKGPKDNPDSHLAREAALQAASTFGMIGLLSTANSNAPTAPWGRDEALGTDEASARGQMWGDSIGDAAGSGGLGFSGIGEGGGGPGTGIGLGNIGTILHGPGADNGIGLMRGLGLGARHAPRAPQVRFSKTEVSGRLPPEVIQRIVRQNHGRFRQCYEQGLVRNPNLEGRIAARFVISREGSVTQVVNGGSDLADAGVVNCVLATLYSLSFPKPEGSIVTVVYPIMLSPN